MAPLGLSSALARITIRPDLGAGLTSFDVMHRNAWTPVFRPVDPETGHPFSLSNILLVPFSGRVSGGGFAFDGAFHAVEPNMPTERYPIHGSAFSAAWTVVETSDHAVTLSLEGTGPGPFHYDALMTYRLDGATLVMELVVTNKAALALPYGLGFHPWFVRDHDTRLAARADRVWLERDDQTWISYEAVSCRGSGSTTGSTAGIARRASNGRIAAWQCWSKPAICWISTCFSLRRVMPISSASNRFPIPSTLSICRKVLSATAW